MAIFKIFRKDRSATSPIMGILLLVAITVLMAIAIAGFAMVSTMDLTAQSHTPQAIIVIDSATIYKPNTTTYQTVILSHKGGDSFNVSDIRVMIAINGEVLPHGLDELPRGSATGFNGIGGVFHSWSDGAPTWEVGEKASMNIATGDTGRPLKDGDKVTVIITHKSSKTIIARPSAIVQDLRPPPID